MHAIDVVKPLVCDDIDVMKGSLFLGTSSRLDRSPGASFLAEGLLAMESGLPKDSLPSFSPSLSFTEEQDAELAFGRALPSKLFFTSLSILEKSVDSIPDVAPSSMQIIASSVEAPARFAYNGPPEGESFWDRNLRNGTPTRITAAESAELLVYVPLVERVDKSAGVLNSMPAPSTILEAKEGSSIIAIQEQTATLLKKQSTVSSRIPIRVQTAKEAISTASASKIREDS